MNRIAIFLLTVVLLAGKVLCAQQDSVSFIDADTPAVATVLPVTDTSNTAFFANLWTHDPHSVGRAALYSAILPGLGQAYNGKYWKLPIVYGALGTSGFFIYYWYDYFDELRTAYIARTDEDPLTVDNLYDYIESDDALLQYVTASKRYLDVMVIITAAIYSLNIIDAIVDAHLYDFDISDDLTMQLRPTYIPAAGFSGFQQGAAGVSIKLRLK